MISSFNSSLLENAVNELSKLPGIGRKTALRLALHMLRRDENEAVASGNLSSICAATSAIAPDAIISANRKSALFAMIRDATRRRYASWKTLRT